MGANRPEKGTSKQPCKAIGGTGAKRPEKGKGERAPKKEREAPKLLDAAPDRAYNEPISLEPGRLLPWSLAARGTHAYD